MAMNAFFWLLRDSYICERGDNRYYSGPFSVNDVEIANLYGWDNYHGHENSGIRPMLAIDLSKIK